MGKPSVDPAVRKDSQARRVQGLVAMFPGQSSRHPDMLARALEICGRGREVVGEASEILGRDLSRELSADNPGLFADNCSIQVGVFLVSHLYMLELADRGIRPELSLGLSLGEYNHLVEINALDFADALRLVDARGRIYSDGPRGVMISLFPCDPVSVARIVEEVGHGVAISNFNSPSQVVIAGPREFAMQAAALFEEREFGQAVMIEDRIPMHTPEFLPVATAFKSYLEAAPWKPATAPYVSNVTATWVHRPASELLVDRLYRHVYSPVRWRECIEAVEEVRPEPVFVELGPRRVLCNLLTRKWFAGERMALEDGGFEPVLARCRSFEESTL